MHGFPDSKSIWDPVIDGLTSAGFRLIIPDMRGFGETDIAPLTKDYDIAVGACPDMLSLLDHFKIDRAHIVGHDFGSPVAWRLASVHPERCVSLAALSVGHMRAFVNAGWAQKWKSLYILFHQFRGLCEWAYQRNDWSTLRTHWSAHGNIEETIALLARPGRLTAGLNWYRANIGVARMLRPPPEGFMGEERVFIPTLGIWSDGDAYLTEQQMTASQDYVNAPWEYSKYESVSHWLQLEAPERLASDLIRHWRNAEAAL
ncbi:MAG: alpha/beta hydrolase [Pseudomonadota bacterium]